MQYKSIKINYVSLSFAILLILAFYVDSYFSYSQQGWLTIALLTMTQFSAGTWIRQTLLRTITIISAILVVVAIRSFFAEQAMIFLFAFSLLISIASLILLERFYFSECIVFVICVLFANFMSNSSSLQAQLLDVLIAASLMLAVSIILTLFSVREAFIKLMLKHVEHLIKMIDRMPEPALPVRRFIFIFNESLQLDTNWIFALGLSPGFRAGFRYYTLQIERAIELLYGIQKVVHEVKLDDELAFSFRSLMTTNKALLNLLQQFFKFGSMPPHSEDWMQDLIRFETLIEIRFPAKVNVLHFNNYDLNLIEMLRYCKDLRQVLLRLLMALPHSLRA